MRWPGRLTPDQDAAVRRALTAWIYDCLDDVMAAATPGQVSMAAADCAVAIGTWRRLTARAGARADAHVVADRWIAMLTAAVEANPHVGPPGPPPQGEPS